LTLGQPAKEKSNEAKKTNAKRKPLAVVVEPVVGRPNDLSEKQKERTE